MAAFVDLSGEQIGLWKVLQRCDPPEGQKGTWFLCRCSCEAQTTKPVKANNLTTFKRYPPKGSGSCGCVGAKKTRDLFRKHGQSGKNRTPTYTAWRSMIRRCCDPKCKSYKDYGGRKENPRTVCERWKTFEHFFADMGERPENTELDRINNEGSYTCGKPECPECGSESKPANCRWVTRADNLRNRGEVRTFPYQGEMLTCGQIAERANCGVSKAALYDRLVRKKLTVEEALALPVAERVYEYEYKGEKWTIPQLVALCGIPRRLLHMRINRFGWTVEEAITTPVKAGQGTALTFEYDGNQKTLKELSELSGISTMKLYRRLVELKWSVQEALKP